MRKSKGITLLIIHRMRQLVLLCTRISSGYQWPLFSDWSDAPSLEISKLRFS